MGDIVKTYINEQSTESTITRSVAKRTFFAGDIVKISPSYNKYLVVTSGIIPPIDKMFLGAIGKIAGEGALFHEDGKFYKYEFIEFLVRDSTDLKNYESIVIPVWARALELTDEIRERRQGRKLTDDMKGGVVK